MKNSAPRPGDKLFVTGKFPGQVSSMVWLRAAAATAIQAPVFKPQQCVDALDLTRCPSPADHRELSASDRTVQKLAGFFKQYNKTGFL
jgi:hypothetical protein